MDVNFGPIDTADTTKMCGAGGLCACITMQGREIGDTGIYADTVNLYVRNRQQAQKLAKAAQDAIDIFDAGVRDE